MAALAAIPFAIAIAFVSARYVASASQQTQRQALIAARDISGAVDLILREGLATLRTLSLSNAALEGDFGSLYRQAQQVSRFLPGTIVAVRRGSDGQQMINTALPWGAPLPKTLDPILLEADRQALATDRPVVTDLYHGVSTKKDLVIVETPLRIKGEEYLLNLAIPPEVILKVIERTSAAKEFWLISVVDKKHRIIARTRDHAQYVGQLATRSFSQNITGSSGTFYTSTLDGTDVFDAFATSELSGWITVAAIPTSEFRAPIQQVAITAMAAFAVGLLFVILLSILYSRYITAKVLKLRDEAVMLGQRKPVGALSTGIEELSEVGVALADASAALIRDEQAKKTLIDELNHRVKNSLATVQSLAQQTFLRTASPAEFKDKFTGRLMALSMAHNALSQSDWLDTDFKKISDAVCPNANDQLVTLGLPAPIRPRAALTMGLVLHELCTNAAKHGALLDPAGRIDLSWDLDSDGLFRFEWSEFTPRPVRPPEKMNFGMKYIQNSVSQELGGELTFEFRPTGLLVRGSFPNVGK